MKRTEKRHGKPKLARLRKRFRIEPDDPLVALANSAQPNFTPRTDDLDNWRPSGKPKPRTPEIVREILEPSPLTLTAAEIVMPVLKSKRVTSRQIQTLLQAITQLRGEIHGANARPDFIEYLGSIPKCPDVFDRIREFHARRRKPLPKGESAKLVRAGRRK